MWKVVTKANMRVEKRITSKEAVSVSQRQNRNGNKLNL